MSHLAGLYAYPPDAVKASKVVLSYLTGGLVDGTPVDNLDALKAAWAVQGYAMSFIPDPAGANLQLAAAPMTQDRMVEYLRELSTHHAKAGFSLPWNQLLALALQIITNILNK
jgi:hypothetical protein